jgi:hypothetical protein
MKIITLLLFFQLFITEISAQQYITVPEFGKVEKEELLMKECSFDKNAGAMYLIDEGSSIFKMNINSSLGSLIQETEYHIRIKIFNKNGYNNANIKIRYPNYNKNISLKNLSAQTYNLDASGNIVVSKVERQTIYDRQINKRFAERIIVFPDVKDGCVIEYKYVLEGYAQNLWYFQKQIPVKISRFTLDLPKELIMNIIPKYNLPLTTGKTKGYSDNTNWYAMENLPGLAEEPYMSNPNDYLQQMEARLVGLDLQDGVRRNLQLSWPDIIKELLENEDFGKQLSKDIPLTDELEALLESVSVPYQKMVIIHEYVRKNMQGNNDDDIWAFTGVKNAWKNKKGTSGEINLILINLLKGAGLDANPILVSTRDNGVIDTKVPALEQFNKVIAFVKIDDKAYVLDATEKNIPANLIPFEVMASQALLIKPINNDNGRKKFIPTSDLVDTWPFERSGGYTWAWTTLWDENHKNRKNIFINAEIDDNGIMKGNATVASFDYAKVELLPLLSEGNKRLIENLNTHTDIKIDSFKFTGNAIDTMPIVENFEFKIPVSNTNDYHYFPGNLFSGLEKNSFIADTRMTDIFFGVKQSFSINSHIFLPDGYQMDAMPANLKMITPDGSIIFSRIASFADGAININYQIEFRDPVYPLDTYPDFREFYKKMVGVLNEKFVYKKKLN